MGQEERDTFVYLLASSTRLKVGLTRHLKKRIQQLERYCGERLLLVATIRTTSAEARQIEGDWHHDQNSIQEGFGDPISEWTVLSWAIAESFGELAGAKFWFVPTKGWACTGDKPWPEDLEFLDPPRPLAEVR